MAEQAIATRELVTDQAAVAAAITRSYGQIGFGLYAPDSESAILYHNVEPYEAGKYYVIGIMLVFLTLNIGVGIEAFSLLTNRLSNSTAAGSARQMKTTLRTLRHVEPVHDIRNLPIAMLLVLAFVAAASIATIYPGWLA